MHNYNLRAQRVKRGLSQAKLAEITGIQQARLSAFELQKRDLSSQEIFSIKDILHSLNDNEIISLKKKRYKKHVKNGQTIASRPRRGYNKSLRNKEYLSNLMELEKKFLSDNKPNLKAISFFAGCGGLCYGIKASGFEIIATNELEEAYKDIYQKNFSEVNFLPNDITEIDTKDLSEVLTNYKNIDLMIGGPPCQGFSLAGKRDVNDNRNTLFQYYLNIAEEIKPKIILMENVRLLTSMKDNDGELVSKRILEKFNSIGYKSSFFKVNAKDYGVPQHRERVIFIGVRKDSSILPSIPSPNYNNKYYSFSDAVSDLEYIESGEEAKFDKYHKAVKHPEHVIEWLIDVPEGKSAHENEDENLRPPSGYNTTYKRQVWDEPAGTVGTTYGMISGCRNVHPIATRALTTREALRLQSFPDSFQLCGKLGNIRTTIGNAVPPLLAYVLGEHIKDTYFSSETL